MSTFKPPANGFPPSPITPITDRGLHPDFQRLNDEYQFHVNRVFNDRDACANVNQLLEQKLGVEKATSECLRGDKTELSQDLDNSRRAGERKDSTIRIITRERDEATKQHTDFKRDVYKPLLAEKNTLEADKLARDRTITGLQEKLGTERTALKKAQDEIVDLNRKRSAELTTITELRGQLKELGSELSTEKKAKHDLGTELEHKKKDCEKVQGELEKERGALKSLRVKYDAALVDNKDLVARLQELEKATSSINDTIAALGKTATPLKGDPGNTDDETKAMEHQVGDLDGNDDADRSENQVTALDRGVNIDSGSTEYPEVVPDIDSASQGSQRHLETADHQGNSADVDQAIATANASAAVIDDDSDKTHQTVAKLKTTPRTSASITAGSSAKAQGEAARALTPEEGECTPSNTPAPAPPRMPSSLRPPTSDEPIVNPPPASGRERRCLIHSACSDDCPHRFGREDTYKTNKRKSDAMAEGDEHEEGLPWNEKRLRQSGGTPQPRRGRGGSRGGGQRGRR